jgi:hypothetical protein
MKALINKNIEWEWIDIKNDLHSIQKIVGGYIELVPIPGVSLYCDEEGKLKELPPTAYWLNPKDGGIVDILCGNLIVFGPYDENGNETDATDKTLELLNKHLVLLETVQVDEDVIMIIEPRKSC